jgi:hypothetical protein
MLSAEQRQQATEVLDGWLEDPDGFDDVATEISSFVDGYSAGDADVFARWLDLGEELIAAQVVTRAPAHVAWAAVFDAFVLVRPDLLDAAFDDLEAQVVEAGGQPIVRPVTSAVDAPPGVLAWLLGAKRTVGPNGIDGWTVRELARLLAYMWLSTGSPDAAVPLVDRIVPAVRLIMYARRVDPHDDVEDERVLRDLLQRAVLEADAAKTEQTGLFAQSVLRSIDAEDPLANRSLTRRFTQGATKGAVESAAAVGRRTLWTWDNLPLIAIAGIAVAVAMTSGGRR